MSAHGGDGKEMALMTLAQVGQQVISLSRAANQARVARGKVDSPIVSASVPTMKLPSAAENALRDYLQSQSPEVIYMLMAIMYLGRGDFGPKELQDRYRDISETFGGKEWAATQMLEKQLLPEYLEEGFRRISRTHVDVDRLLSA
jgi:hypothetical protein